MLKIRIISHHSEAAQYLLCGKFETISPT